MGLFRKGHESPDLFGNRDTNGFPSRDFIASKQPKAEITDHIRAIVAPALKGQVDLEPYILGEPAGTKTKVLNFGGRILVGGWYRGGDNGDNLAVLGGPQPTNDGPERVAA